MNYYKQTLCLIVFLFISLVCFGESKSLELSAFSIKQDVSLSASPTAVYDAVTGDISGWWDHSFSEKPRKLFIEPKPGGGFYEIFNDAGDGVLHATVIYAQRGKLLRLSGPLGLSGKAVSFVTTFEFSPQGSGTKLHLTVNVAGQTSAEEGKIVDAVWHHFLVERLKPYVDSGAYKKKK